MTCLCKKRRIPISNPKPESPSRGLPTLVPPRFSSIPSVVQSASRSAKERDFRLTTAEDEEFAMPQAGRRVILLVGFMGAGKTSVGKLLAKRMKTRFVDLDDLIVAREGRSIAKIFEEAGESGFRSRESAALQEILFGSSSFADAVVALGGGALSRAENRAALERAQARKIFLDAPVEELYG